MRPPPALTVLVAPCRAWRAACGLLGCAAGAVMAAWGAGHVDATPLLTGCAVLGGAVAGLPAGLRCAGPMRPARLHWDGGSWFVDDEVGDLRLMLDLDRWLLLRLQVEGRRAGRWLAVSCARGAGDWRALRTALYSRRPEATPATPRVRPPDRATD